MGSRKIDGTTIGQPDFRAHHIGSLIQITSLSGVDSTVENTSTSVNRELFTITDEASGSLGWEYTRCMGPHVSVSSVEASGSIGGPLTRSERKVFYLDSDRGKSSGFADWNIFDNNGVAVGAGDGTTDTDTTPSGVQ